MTTIYTHAVAGLGIAQVYSPKHGRWLYWILAGILPVVFFWPAADQRYGNWGPIPVSDLGFELPDPRRSRALRSEMIWVWLPTTAWIIAITIGRAVKRHRSDPGY